MALARYREGSRVTPKGVTLDPDPSLTRRTFIDPSLTLRCTYSKGLLCNRNLNAGPNRGWTIGAVDEMPKGTPRNCPFEGNSDPVVALGCEPLAKETMGVTP